MTMHSQPDDPTVLAGWKMIERGGSSMPAYYASPRDMDVSTPSIVIAMHLTGVDAPMRETACRLAAAGFATVVPNLYTHFDNVPNGDEVSDVQVFAPFARQLHAEMIDPDILAAVHSLKTTFPEGKRVILGFCMGGQVALRRTIGYSQVFSAAAIWYGAISYGGNSVDPTQVDIPIVASFGADDKHISVESVEAFRSGLRVANDIKIYPNADHGFFHQGLPVYHPGAAEDSWRRSVNFLKKWLR